MPYEISEKNHVITIKGSIDELKDWIIALDLAIAKGGCRSQLEEYIAGLEKMYEKKQFNFNRYERIYIDNKSIMYVPNVSHSARDFWFKILKKNFLITKEIYEKKGYEEQ